MIRIRNPRRKARRAEVRCLTEKCSGLPGDFPSLSAFWWNDERPPPALRSHHGSQPGVLEVGRGQEKPGRRIKDNHAIDDMLEDFCHAGILGINAQR
jgi:hypothetical protein